MINRKTFYDQVRKSLFGNTLTQQQVDGMNAILDEWEKRKLTDLRWLAYMFATAKHETNATMQAVKEAYWLSEEWRRTHLRYYPYYGRGLVQLTWLTNYEKMAKFTGLDLVGNPDLALDLHGAVQVMFEGMTRGETGVGDFTNKSLEDYFNATVDDPYNARRIINSLDKAQAIADIHNLFLKALKVATQ
jgi:hypothetical protein